MTTTLSYNGYTHQADQCWFTINRTGSIGGTGRLNATLEQWTIHGRVQGANAAAVDTLVVAWENAVRDGGDLVFSLGSTMRLLSSDCLEGTHVRRFSWLAGYDGVRGSGAEGVLRRTWMMVIEGKKLATSDTNIVQWRETIRSVGSGGAKVIPVGSLTGGIQAQQVQAVTPFYLVQSGYAVGLTAPPTPPLPLFTGIAGVYYFPETLEQSRTSPKYGKNLNTMFPVSWNYRAWSASNLIGSPSNF